jgi:type I restriction enzyme S subunit
MVAEGYKETEIGLIPIEWEVVKVGDILNVQTGKMNAQDQVENGKYPFFTRSVDVQTIDTFAYDTEALFIAGEGNFKVKYYNGKFNLHQRTYMLTSIKDANIKFLLNAIQPKVNKLISTSVGSTVPSLRKPLIENLKIPFPPLKEQEKIADILSTADEKIDAIASQIQKAETLKKGLLQKLLSEGIGHSKFKDSELGKIPESWEISELEKATTFVDYRGKTPTKTKSGVFLITARNIKGNKIDYNLSNEYIAVDEYETVMSRGKPQIGDVLLTTEAPLGQIASIDKEYVALAQRIIKYRGIENYLDNSFLKHYFISNKFQDLLLLNSTGSTVKGIKGSRLKKLKIIIPPLEEQIQIADILSTADEKVEVLRAKKEKYETLKKGLLQKLLSGEVRV